MKDLYQSAEHTARGVQVSWEDEMERFKAHYFCGHVREKVPERGGRRPSVTSYNIYSTIPHQHLSIFNLPLADQTAFLLHPYGKQ